MNDLQAYEATMLAEISPLEATSLNLRAEAQAYHVDTDTIKDANELKKRINAHTKTVKEMRLELTRPIDGLKDVLLKREREILAPAEEGKSALGSKILAYEEEQEQIRQAEERRIDVIVRGIESHYRPGMTANQVTTARAAGKEIIEGLNAEDAKIPRIKLALLNLSNRLTERMNDIEIEEQRAQKKKLEDDEARILREQQELEARKERARIDEAQLEADKAAARAERDRPKSNIVETTEFEILDPNIVPRALCSPDSTKIRTAIKAGVTEIEGVRIFTTKKVR